MAKQGIEAPTTKLFLVYPETLQVITDKKDPLYDPRVEWPIDEAMVKSIMHSGVHDALHVKKIGGEIFVMEGRQRRINAIEANKRLDKEGKEHVRVPVKMEHGDEADMFGLMITCNELRTADGPMQKAQKAARYIAFGRTEDEAAVQFGVSVQSIKLWLKMLDLSAPVRKAIDAGQVAPTAAVKLANLTPEKQAKALPKILDKSTGKATIKKVARAAKDDGDIKQGRRVPNSELLELSKAKSTPDEFKCFILWMLGVHTVEQVRADLPWLMDDSAADGEPEVATPVEEEAVFAETPEPVKKRGKKASEVLTSPLLEAVEA